MGVLRGRYRIFLDVTMGYYTMHCGSLRRL